jgi:hypothetical protein
MVSRVPEGRRTQYPSGAWIIGCPGNTRRDGLFQCPQTVVREMAIVEF